MNHKNLLTNIHVVAKHNREEIEKYNGDQGNAKNLIQIIHDGISVYDPFYDASMRFEVNPIQHYGVDLMIRMVEDYKELES